MCCWDGLLDVVDDVVVSPACASLCLVEELSYEEWCVFSLEVEVGEEVVVEGFDFVGPLLVAVVAASLVEEHSFDDSCAYCYAGTCDEFLVWLVAVFLHVVLEPVGFVCECCWVEVFHEVLYSASPYCYVDDANGDGIWQVCHHGSSEVVAGCESCVGAAEGWKCCVPAVGLPNVVGVFVWYGWHHLESWVHSCAVLCLDGCVAFHVRLSEAEVDVEIGVCFCVHVEVEEECEDDCRAS